MHQRQVDANQNAGLVERAPNATQVTIEPNVTNKDHQDKPELSSTPGGAHLLHRLEALPSNAKVGLVGSIVLAIGTTFALMRTAAANPEMFTTGELTNAQACAFLISFGLMYAYGLLEVASRLHKEPIVFKRLILSEESETQISGAAEFALYMVIFYFCDRTTFIPREKKKYDQDTFWFLWFMLMVAALFTLRKAKAPKSSASPSDGSQSSTTAVVAAPEVYHVSHLQRDQTEEWKGWMQIMFLWYHYFEVKPIYNVIRLYIAAYVWMTGFGNFSYYYIRKDFSLSRFLQMQWRLNFMVVWVCAILSNEYMLYYICMLHTTFTLFIYAGLGLLPQYNVTPAGVAVKVLVLSGLCFCMWDISDNIFDTLWKPLTWLVQYHDPYDAKRSIMSEWRFRSYLDHYIWIVGMLCAFNHPRIESWLQRIDNLPSKASNAIKSAVVAVCLIIGYWYVNDILLLPKKEYNALHPYTSFIPILLFIVLRNISQVARMYHMHLFEFLGKTTLETYIAQFHIWMATTGVNGAPKRLLRVLPAGWPLVNFAVVSIFFFFVSYRLFQTTNVIKGAVLPAKATNAVLKKNVAFLVACVAIAYVLAVSLTFL